ncbi:hypothetical protein [Lachnospira multipara]|uniref:Uncharacterized protein n=1 Tax=Lachnospira multipara TaxID=28051 RepID=A0A1H5V6T7_9FIRM|nr:hypothetical protein [Lachnospira multipara]SEF83085.1 hypothetical protein SAMN05216537_11010 [Lachnospira multipara]
MRLRLDKLVLSAGLALAIVATTIPVGASINTSTSTTTTTATEGLTFDNTVIGFTENDFTKPADEAAFAKAVTGKVTTAAAAVNNLTTVTKKTDVEAEQNGNTAAPLGDSLKNVIGETAAAAKKAHTYTVTVTSTYSFTNYPYALTAAAEDETAAKTAAENAARSLIEESKVTAGTSFSCGTYGVAIENQASFKATTESETPLAKDAPYVVNGDVKVTETYTVNSLPSGYTYDLVLGTAPVSTLKYTVYRQGTNTTDYEKITDVTPVTTGQYVSTTDLTSTYFLVTETVSAKGALLFAPTEGKDADTDVVVTSGDYTATITKNDAANGADYTLAEDAPESATVAGYFNITLKKGTEAATNGPSITFKIAVPVDVTASEGKQIKWQVVRVHDYGDGNGDTVELLSATEENGYIVFSSEYFSDYALIYTEVAADTTEEETNNETETESATEAGTETTTTTAGSSTTSTTTSTKTADNSMMPLFMTTLLLALCAGSLAIYKEKKTN